MRLRTTAGLGAAGLLAVTGLSGCDKPRPGVTVVSGGSTQRLDAACWSRDEDKTVTLASCTPEGATLKVTPGRTIGISVDKEVADAGWEPAIGNSALVAKPLHETYYRFALSEQDLAPGSLTLRVIAVDKSQKNPRGFWSLSLVHD